MHPDKKTGLALGILLIGVTGAFFFRNERPRTEPRLQDPQSLDDQIAQQQGPRPHIDLERPEPVADDSSPMADHISSPVAGVGQVDSRSAETAIPHDVSEPALPAVRKMPSDRMAKSTAAPDPIPTVSPRRDNAPIPLPRGNRGWEVVKSEHSAAAKPNTEAALPSRPMRRHVVRRGETLSGLAARYLGSSARFEEIYRANRDVLKRPNDLRIGMTIRIPARSASRSGSSQVRSGSPHRERSSADRTKSGRRLPAQPVSRERKSRTPGDRKSQSRRHSKFGSWFIPVRHSPFVRKPRHRSSAKSSPRRKRKKLTQTPPPGFPNPAKRGALPRR